MKHKLFQGLVALVLVCVLVVNVSPIRAEASALPEFAGVVPKVIPFAKVVEPAALGVGGTVFCWVAMGLGVLYKASQAVQAYNDYQDFTGELETTIYYYPDGSWSYGVDMGFVDRVRAYLFKSGTIVNVTTLLTTSATSSLAGYIRDFETAFGVTPHCYWYTIDGGHVYFFLTRTSVYLSNGNYYPIDGSTGWRLTFNGNSLSKSAGGYSKLVDPGVPLLLFKGDDMLISSSYEIGAVASPDVDISVGYPEWYTNARPTTNPDTQEQVTVLPVPLNPSVSPETQIGTITQPDIWQGSIADPMPDTGTVPDGSIAETPWEAFKKWISEGWNSIIQAIPTADSIGQSIGNVIKSIFVPDADFISEKWNAIRSRFDFADSISSSGELILDVLNSIDPEPPVIYVDLGDAEGSYYLGGQVAFLDLRWYERYKPTGDAIISAFLWLVFVWRMFIKLPGIIGGLPGDFVMQGVTDLGLAGWLPARKKEYENQRQENRRFFKK